MARIFICYRREDSSGHAGRLRDSLTARLGRNKVFWDIETIGPGEDFLEAMSRAIASCDIFLAVIGTHWLTADNEDGTRRLDAPDDYVRHEIIEALNRGVRVIPVLVGGADVPLSADLPEPLKPLAVRNAITLNDEGWEADVERLLAAIGSEARMATAGKALLSVPARRGTVVAAVSAGALLIMVATVAAPIFNRSGRAPADNRVTTASALPTGEAAASGEVATSGKTARRTGSVETATDTLATARSGGAGRATPTLPAGGEAELAQTVYELTEADIVPHAGGATLTLGFRLTNNSLYDVLFTDSEFRVLQGGEPLSPTRSVNEIVPAESAKDGTLTFDIPAKTKTVVLRISHAGETADVPVDLAGAQGLTAEASREARRAGRATFQVPLDRASSEMRFGELSCVLQSATIHRYAHKLTLTLAVRVENRGRYDAGFGDGQFRLRFDDMAHAPADSFYKIVRADGTGEASVVFDLPVGTREVVLRVRFGEATAEMPLALARESS